MVERVEIRLVTLNSKQVHELKTAIAKNEPWS